MCLSPDEMTTKELLAIIADYRKKALKDKYGPEYYNGRADQLQAIVDARNEDGTTDIVPETTPRHLNSTVN